MNSRYNKKLLKVSDRIITRIAKNDVEAFEQLYYDTSGAVFGLAMSIVANQADAEDVVQDTYISINNNAYKYQGNGKAMAWIFTITRNHALMKIRDRKKRIHVNLDDVHNLGVESNVEQEMYNEQLIQLLLKVLKEDERQIVIMYVMSNMKHKEISDILQIPLSTVLSKYNRSLKKLKTEMEANEYEK
ncbi:MAG: sigma-70 family RNA polymerase sigma factor [Candidatus Izemoplasma sp.]